MVGAPGIEPGTASLKGCRSASPAPSETAPTRPPLSLPLSPSGAASPERRDPLALADELLLAASRSSNPAPLIAAARALVAEAAERRADARQDDRDGAARTG